MRTAALLGGLWAVGCSTRAPASQPEQSAPVSAPVATAGDAVERGSNRSRIAGAVARIEAGRDIDVAREVLEDVLADEALSVEERDEATMALSHALEAQGDQRGATGAIERLVQTHAGDDGWRLSSVARGRLGQLARERARTSPRKVEARVQLP